MRAGVALAGWVERAAPGSKAGSKPQVPSREGCPQAGYPPDWLERRVSPAGSICLYSIPLYLSEALAGFVVGLQPVAERLDVWFDYLRSLLSKITRIDGIGQRNL